MIISRQMTANPVNMNGVLLAVIIVLFLAIPHSALAQACHQTLVCISKSVTDPEPYDPIVPGPVGGDVDDILNVWRVPGDTSYGTADGRRAWQGLTLHEDFPGDETPSAELGDQVKEKAKQIDLSSYLQGSQPQKWFDETEVENDILQCKAKSCHWVLSPQPPEFTIPMPTGFEAEVLSGDKLDLAIEYLKSDPVNPSTGELVYKSSDLSFPGIGVSFAHVRMYRSRVFYDGPTGFGWDHTYNQRLMMRANEECGDEVLYMTGEGITILFRPESTTTSVSDGLVTLTTRYQAEDGIRLELTRAEIRTITTVTSILQSLEWRLQAPDGSYGLFDANGLLTALRDSNDQGLTLRWEESPRPEDKFRIATVVDSVGREISYQYNENGRLRRIVEHESGLFAEYAYNENGDLVSATDSTGRTQTYEYSSGFTEEVENYVPEGFLRSACELACAPSYQSCDAGGGCDDAPDQGHASCTQGCVDCAFSCEPACKDFCRPGGDGHALCRQECSEKCTNYCDDTKIHELCQAAWNGDFEVAGSDIDSVQQYCEDCFNRVQSACGFSCASIAHCFAQITDDDSYLASLGACLSSFGLGGVVDGIIDGVASIFSGIGDLAQCIAGGFCSIPFVPCDVDCDMDLSEGHIAELCNNVCVECLALGKTEECVPPVCIADGVSCEEECEKEFWGVTSNRSTCDPLPPPPFGCPVRLANECLEKCPASCTVDCARHCIGECREGCVESCDLQDCVADCEAVPDDEWVQICEDYCVEGCIDDQHERGPYIGPKYGHVRDLNHNLLRIFDGNGDLYLENVYGETLWEPSFDAVVEQRMGDEIVEFHYRDLESEERLARTPGELTRTITDVREIVAVDDAIGGKPTHWPVADATAQAFSDSLNDFVTVDICPGPCIVPRPDLPLELYVPSEATLFVLEPESHGIEPEGLEVSVPLGVEVAPMWFRLRRDGDLGGLVMVPETGVAVATVPTRIKLHIGETSISFERDASGLLRARPLGAVAAELDGRRLFMARHPDGHVRAYFATPNAVLHVAGGSCHRAFTALTREDGTILFDPPNACTAEIVVSPLASRIDDPALRRDALGDSASLADQDVFRPTHLVPERHTVRLRRGERRGLYRIETAERGGAAPTSVKHAIMRLLQSNSVLLSPPRAGDATSAPVFSFHIPEALRRIPVSPTEHGPVEEGGTRSGGVDLSSITITDLPDEFVADPGPRCVGGFYDSPRRGRGEFAPGPRPSRVTVAVDTFGVHWALYFDRQGNPLRIVNHGTGAERNYNYDSQGRLTGLESPLRRRACSRYDITGNLIQTVEYPQPGLPGEHAFRIWRFAYTSHPVRVDKVLDPSQPGVALEDLDWDTRGNLVAIRSATGDVTIIENDPTGRPVNITSPDGSEALIEYDPQSSRISRVTTDATGSSPIVRSFEYDRAGHPIRVESPLGAVSAFEWEGGRLESLSRTTGDRTVSIQLSWDDDSQIEAVSLPSRTLHVKTETNGAIRRTQLVANDESLPPAVRCELIRGGRLLEQIREDGTRLRFEYDGEGRFISVEEGAFPASDDDWDDDCPAPPDVQEIFVIEEREYDLEGRPIRVREADGQSTTLAYDGFGRLVRITDAGGTSTRRGFDRTDRVLWASSYGPAGVGIPPRAPELGDPGLLGGIFFEYDQAGRLVARRSLHFDHKGDPVGDGESSTLFSYEPAAGSIAITDDSDSTITYSLDGSRRLVRVDLPTGDVVRREFVDSNRTVITRRSAPTASGELVEIARLDEMGNLTALEIEAAGNNVPLGSWQYDPEGRVIELDHPDGRVRSFQYDAFGRLKSMTNAFGDSSEELSFSYDPVGRLIRRISLAPDPFVVEYEYDVLGRLTAIERPENLVETITYEGASPRKATHTYSDGVVHSFEYAPTGELIRLVAGPQVDEFVYDAAGRLVQASTNGLGPVDSSDDIVTTFTWDSLWNPTSESSSHLEPGLDVNHTFDGRRLPISSHIGTASVTREFDALGRLESLSITGPGTASVSFEYGGIGGPNKIVRSNGVETEYLYDERGRPARQIERREGETIAAWRWEAPLFGFAPRLSGLTLPGGSEIASVFLIGSGERVLAEKHGVTGLESLVISTGDNPMEANAAVEANVDLGNESRRYTLDGRHNWLELDRAGSTLDADPVRNALDAYLTFGSETLTYDERGALATRDEDRYEHDAFGRLVRVEQEGVMRRYRYDALGRVVMELDATGELLTRYGYDRLQRAMRVDSDGAVDLYFQGQGLDEHVVWVTSDSNVQFPHMDRQGSIFLVTNGLGEPLEWYEYTAFGETTIRSPSGDVLSESAIGNRFGFHGQPRDSSNGLYEMRARRYAPDLGRFLSSDPLGFVSGSNPYAFVDGAPLSWRDPLGLDKESTIEPWKPGGDTLLQFVLPFSDVTTEDVSAAVDAFSAALSRAVNSPAFREYLLQKERVLQELNMAVQLTCYPPSRKCRRARWVRDQFLATGRIEPYPESPIGAPSPVNIGLATAVGGALIYSYCLANPMSCAAPFFVAGSTSNGGFEGCGAVAGVGAGCAAGPRMVAMRAGTPLADDTIIVIGSNNKPGNFILRAGVDDRAIGAVTTPGKSATIATNLTPETEIAKMFGRAPKRGDTLSGAFVEDIRAAGFDVVYAPTAKNTLHVRIVSASNTFDEAGREWLSLAFDRLLRIRR